MLPLEHRLSVKFITAVHTNGVRDKWTPAVSSAATRIYPTPRGWYTNETPPQSMLLTRGIYYGNHVV